MFAALKGGLERAYSRVSKKRARPVSEEEEEEEEGKGEDEEKGSIAKRQKKDNEQWAEYGNKAVIVWDRERVQGKVVRHRGKMLKSIGFLEGAETWLFPEEVLFLSERAQCTAIVDDDRISVKDLYSVLIAGKNLPSLASYWVYAHLRGLGYYVFRAGFHKGKVESLPRLWHSESLGAAAALFQVLSFEVYQPANNFSKKSPGKPSFYVLITSYTDNVPALPMLSSLIRQAAGIPLKIAVVASDGTVLMFDIESGIPILPS